VDLLSLWSFQVARLRGTHEGRVLAVLHPWAAHAPNPTRGTSGGFAMPTGSCQIACSSTAARRKSIVEKGHKDAISTHATERTVSPEVGGHHDWTTAMPR